jgi:hypothetical protein
MMSRQIRRALERSKTKDGFAKEGGPSRAELDRLSHEIDTTGCGHCGNHFGVGMPYLTGRTKTGWSTRCPRPECIDDFLPNSPKFVGTSVSGDDPWMEADREWFLANPNRNWRLRWPMPGEIETQATDEALAEQTKEYSSKVSNHARAAMRRKTEGAKIVVAVYQFEPGKRSRTPIEYRSDDPPESYTDAAIPVLMPFLVEMAERHRVMLKSNPAEMQKEQDKVRQRRLEATASLAKP